MGLGLLMAVPSWSRTRALRLLERVGETPYVIGDVIKGPRKVIYE